jgi:Glycosyl hydrolases family 2, TIM barrel domain
MLARDDEVRALRLDEHGTASLDGRWDFFPGARSTDVLDDGGALGIEVPGLWEAQGHLDLDGTARYRRRFRLADARGWWTLRFGAVMDRATVWLNGVLLGGHDCAFTPFTFDPTGALRPGDNVLDVEVVDPAVDDAEHLRSAHGKQGWANHVFPSRPSLYMTYGGIWQTVTIQRHGPLVVDDLFLNGDPDDLRATVTVTNRSPDVVVARLTVRAVGRLQTTPIELRPATSTSRTLVFGSTDAPRWEPAKPTLHDASVDVTIDDGTLSDARTVRFGLRTVRRRGRTLLLNDVPYRMKSALVQGFRADVLYAEGSREQIEAEVTAAQEMGFNTLRLHIKAFDPRYLDVCDERGMLLHCDMPVAEPVAHDELGSRDESELGERAAGAVDEQVRRDRNHPSIILWSVMNELALDRLEVRGWDRYERFARSLVGVARAADPTRPVIENDWIEPDPDRVFDGDVLTAHWYGRLHAEYLRRLESSCRTWSELGRPLFVTEFGDWGLPPMPELTAPPFWDTRALYMQGLAETRWPATIGRFVRETQRYQGLSDRLQGEVFRRHDHLGGYCVTELTDVPHELNGILDLHRRPKPNAVAEITRLNQTVLPMLRLDSLVVTAGTLVEAELHVANDGPELHDVVVEVGFGDTVRPLGMERLLALDTSELDDAAIAARFEQTTWAVRLPRVDGYRAAHVAAVRLPAPRFAGSHDLVVRLRAGDRAIAENRYPVHVVTASGLDGLTVQLVGSADATRAALSAVGARVGDRGPVVVGEDALDGTTGDDVSCSLRAGETVVVLAQLPQASAHYPVPIELRPVETVWGSSVFHFTTDSGALAALPRRNVLVAEDSTVQARSVVSQVDDGRFPEVPVVIAFKPVPDAMTGTVVGSHPVAAGRLVFCQYRLEHGAATGDAAAHALLADLVRWAALPRPRLEDESTHLADGRRVTRYRHRAMTAR